jgi:CHAT domain
MKNNVPFEFWLALLTLHILVGFLLFLLDYRVSSNTLIIEEPSDDRLLSNILIMEEPSFERFYSKIREVNHKKLILYVNWNNHQSELSYAIFSPDPSREWFQSIPDHSLQIINFWNKLNCILSDAIPRGTPSGETWDDVCLTLQGLGQNLFECLVPSAVAEHIKNLESGSSVSVSTNEQWIPWELMYDGQKFLGDKFIFTRYPRPRTDRRITLNGNISRPKKLKRIGKIVNVIGGNIGELEVERASKLFDSLSPPILIEILKKQSISVLKSALQEADILHFTCHGHLNPLNLLQNFSDKSPTKNLCLDTVKQLQIKPGSFVFANACASTVPVQESFSEFTGFGWEFYQEGADIFIGTLGIIPTEYAISFAENVYDGFFRQDVKLTIGEAVANAKRIAASKNNFFWLLYCVYGDPDFCFEAIE